jgi:hypothetical protein
VFPSDLPGVNPATLNEMILYCRLMTKCIGLGDSTELSRVGLSQPRVYITRDRALPSPANPYWGFPHSSVCAAERREEGKSGRSGGLAPRRRRRTTAGGRRGHEEPDEGEAVRDSKGVKPERDAAVNTDDAPPSSSSLRRPHRRPTVVTPSLAPPFFLVHSSGRAFEPPRAERGAPPFPHERPPRRAMPARSRHRGYPRPQRPGALVYGWLPRCLAGRTKDFPAPRRRAMHRARVVPCVQCFGLCAEMICAVRRARWW